MADSAPAAESEVRCLPGRLPSTSAPPSGAPSSISESPSARFPVAEGKRSNSAQLRARNTVLPEQISIANRARSLTQRHWQPLLATCAPLSVFVAQGNGAAASLCELVRKFRLSIGNVINCVELFFISVVRTISSRSQNNLVFSVSSSMSFSALHCEHPFTF